MIRKISASALALAALISVGQVALAADEYNVTNGLTAAGAPLGLHGVDPVAFLSESRPIEGTAQHTLIHDGVAYYFATADNLETFGAEPAAYLPQNGGFCTYGVSVGKKFDGDPNYAEVIDGKLYVFLNEEIFQLYQQDRQGTIAKAEENWPEIVYTPASEL